MPNSDHYPEYYSAAGGPWVNNPCWNDDWERDLLSDGYKTMAIWNKLGRVVKKNEKGIYLSCARCYVFNIEETEENIRLAKFFTKKRNKPVKKEKRKKSIVSKNQLILFLVRNKFEYIQTVSNVWNDAFKISLESKQLFILFRSNGVNIKYYDGTNGRYSIKETQYSFKSGYRLNLPYNESSILIFSFIIQLISVFKMGGDVKHMMQSTY